MQGDAFAFEAGGKQPSGAGVANDEVPLAVDARAIAGKPLPEIPGQAADDAITLLFLNLQNRRGFSQEASRTLGTGESSS